MTGRTATPVADAEADGLPGIHELDLVEGEALGRVLLAGRFRQCRRQLRVIERRFALPGRRINQDELLRAAGKVIAVPEAVVVAEPVWRDAKLVLPALLLE